MASPASVATSGSLPNTTATYYGSKKKPIKLGGLKIKKKPGKRVR